MNGHYKPGYHPPRQSPNPCPYSNYRRSNGRRFNSSRSPPHDVRILKISSLSPYAPQSCDPCLHWNEFACPSVVEHPAPPSVIWPDRFATSTFISDEEAAKSVERYLRPSDSSRDRLHAEQELIRLILSSPFEERRLPEVLHYANIVFFDGWLTASVWPLRWRPSSQESGDIIGTTELRRTRSGRFETRITLSTSILQNSAYSQRLVLSTLLHEAIHSYLFVRRGFAATENGGHSRGFRHIARLIDEWIGDETYLQLHRTEAILENFETKSKCGWRMDTSTWGTEEHGFKWVRSDWVNKVEHRDLMCYVYDTARYSPPR